MKNVQAEKYVRHQIRKIIGQRLDEAQSKILGGGGKGGRYPKELMNLFGGETVGELMSRKNPGGLMTQLNVSAATGADDYERLLDILKKGVAGRPEMKAVYGTSFKGKDDGKGRKGVYVPVNDITVASGRFFLRELLTAALGSGFLKLDGHVRVEITGDGVLIYPAKNESERWGSASSESGSSPESGSPAEPGPPAE
tara:strand:+ start:6711 stop:7301 length:591 start_codon:yes stop_codon:yes gene_type:complete